MMTTCCFFFYITVHWQKAELLNIICSAAEFCLILLPAWAHNNGPICPMQPVFLHKPEKNKKINTTTMYSWERQKLHWLFKYEPQEEKQRFNWGFYWFTGLLTLSICRDAVDVIWVGITFRSRCAMRKCWVACKKCTAEEQLAVAPYRRAAKTPKRRGYEPTIINTPKQFPACSVPKISWMLSQSAQTKGLIANQQDPEKTRAPLHHSEFNTEKCVYKLRLSSEILSLTHFVTIGAKCGVL